MSLFMSIAYIYCSFSFFVKNVHTGVQNGSTVFKYITNMFKLQIENKTKTCKKNVSVIGTFSRAKELSSLYKGSKICEFGKI